MIIAFSGKMAAGKDTCANYMIPELEHLGFNFFRKPFAGPLKDEYCLLAGITREELERDKDLHRIGLQSLGQSRRDEDPDYWIRALEASLMPWENIIITDLRYKNEFDWAKKRGAILIRVYADRETRSKRREIKGGDHPSEVDLDDIPRKEWDTIVYNESSLEDLELRIKSLVLQMAPLLTETGLERVANG